LIATVSNSLHGIVPDLDEIHNSQVGEPNDY